VVAYSVKHVLVGVLAAVGALYLGRHALSWVMSPNYGSVPDNTDTHSFQTPDGAYKAVSFLSVGGGSLSPYCFQVVGVVAAAQPDANALAPPNRVFTADCHNGVGILANNAIVWKSARELQISVDVSKVVDVHLKGYIYFGNSRIFVSYVDRHES
jgi:hypothetical protein